MRVMVLVKATKESESGGPIDLNMLEAMGRFNDELTKAGILIDADGLKPSSNGVRVNFSGSNRTVTNGPFKPADVSELVAGYWIWEVKSMDEAIEWVKRCPNPMPTDSIIEIRPFYTEQEFGELIESAKALEGSTAG
jgi:hypothetical protein